ncbi:uncharacterized protein LOC115240794 [Formica exsecta]|uniref:uncharacterized protein LOC115240794 n=1 Tax=Formica exsecta TaxID=72781 RepID=UPI0011427E62|nr:uncharacterized protein LOC115240794 [Formica exsecta]
MNCVPLPRGEIFPNKLSDSIRRGRNRARPCKPCPSSCDGDVCSTPPSRDDGKSTTAVNDRNDTTPTTTATSSTTSSTITTTTTTTENPLYQCPKEVVDYPVNIAHPCGCRKYQVCENGVKRIAFCKKGYLYDAPRRMCNYERAVKCPHANPCDDEVDSFSLYNAECGDLDHPRNYQFQTLYRDMYASCTDANVAEVVFCPDGQYFNADVEFCLQVPGNRMIDWGNLDDGTSTANRCRYCYPTTYDNNGE